MTRAVVAPSLRLEQLTLAYPRGRAVEELSGEFLPGSLTAVVGPNGAGKSTLLAALAGQMRPASGRVIAQPATGDIAWLPQQSAIDRSFPMRAADLVALGLWRRLGSARAPDARQRRAVLDALDQAGAASYAYRSLDELSVGQFQRVLFARVVVQEAAVVLLDEPFAAVDAQTAADLVGLIECWHRQGRTVIAVLHDLECVRAHFPLTLLLDRRCIAWGHTADVLGPATAVLAGREAVVTGAICALTSVHREAA